MVEQRPSREGDEGWKATIGLWTDHGREDFYIFIIFIIFITIYVATALHVVILIKCVKKRHCIVSYRHMSAIIRS
jgi:hypothetical protein